MCVLIHTVPNCGVQRPTDVSGEDRGGRAIVDVVRPGDGLVVVLEALHGHDRAKHFSLDDLGVLLDVGDQARLVEEAPPAERCERSATEKVLEQPLEPASSGVRAMLSLLGGVAEFR